MIDHHAHSMLFANLELARRLELVDAVGGVEFAQTYARLFPTSAAAWLSVAGGHAVYVSPDSPIAQAFGLGLSQPVTITDVEQLEQFYRSRRSSVQVEVCPLADPSLLELFSTRGYKPVEHSNVLVRALKEEEAEASLQTRVRVRQATSDEEDRLAWTVARGFTEEGECSKIWWTSSRLASM